MANGACFWRRNCGGRSRAGIAGNSRIEGIFCACLRLSFIMDAASKMGPPRALVIGAGPMADFTHLPVLSRLRSEGLLTLAIICDLDGNRAATACAKFGFQEQSGDADAALERADIDLVYIFASAQIHYQFGMRALQNGKHLFVEKPVAPSFLLAQQLAAFAQSQGRIAAGGHNRRFHPALCAARNHAGRAGWRSAEVIFDKPMLGIPPRFGARSWLSGNGIHALDALVWQMGGLPRRLAAHCDSNDLFSALLQWDDGRQAVFLSNNAAGHRREDYIFHARGESCRVRDNDCIVSRESRDDSLPIGAEDSFESEHRSFLDAVTSGTQPLHALAQIAPSLLLCELIEQGFCGSLPEARDLPERISAPPAAQQTILVAEPATLLPALQRLMPRYRLVSLQDVQQSGEKRADVVAALLGRGAPALSDDLLEKLPNLAIVGIMGLSVARFRPMALIERGICLVNASQSYAETVAEFALGLAILARRRAFIGHADMQAGGWSVTLPQAGMRGMIRRAGQKVRPVLEQYGLGRAISAGKAVLGPDRSEKGKSRDLTGAKIGLIGWGANAKAFAQQLRHFNSEILVYSDHAPPREIEAVGAQPAPLDAVLAAEIVSLHRGLTPETLHGLGHAELARLRPGTVLINIARGALIDPDALLARLRKGDIFACLDSFEEEPLPASHPLRLLPNVFLTPHIAGGSPEMHLAAASEVVEKVAQFLSDGCCDDLPADRLSTMT